MADQVQTEAKAEERRPRSRATGSGKGHGGGGGSPFRIYKPGQGIRVRWGTAIGAGVLSISGAFFVANKIQIFAFGDDLYVRTLVPVGVLLAAAYLIFWVVGRKPGVIDFMIATEGEMKKVNWSTRREVWGATRVVIVTVLALATLLFVVDVMFMLLFGSIGVLKNVKILQLFIGDGSS